MRVGLWRKLNVEELILLNCGVGEDSWESLGQQGDPTSPFLFRKSVLNIHWKIDAKAETPILWQPDAKKWLIWKDPHAGKDWRQGERGWQRMRWLDGVTHATDLNLSKLQDWQWTGRPGMLQSMGSQRVGHDWVTELNWTETSLWFVYLICNSKYLLLDILLFLLIIC